MSFDRKSYPANILVQNKLRLQTFAVFHFHLKNNINESMFLSIFYSNAHYTVIFYSSYRSAGGKNETATPPRPGRSVIVTGDIENYLPRVINNVNSFSSVGYDNALLFHLKLYALQRK